MTDDRKTVEYMMAHEFGFIPDRGEVVYPIPFDQQIQITRELIHCLCRQCQPNAGDPLPEQRHDLIQWLLPALRDGAICSSITKVPNPRFKCTSRREIAAGVMPDIRA